MSPLVLPVGLLIGLSLGALGGGGSVLTVPALVYLLGQGPHQATTSSLLIVGTTSLIALVPHARRGNVRFGQGLAFGALGTVGSLAGSALAAHVRPAVLLSAFAALMLLVASLMLRRSRRGADAPGELGTGPTEPMLTLRPLTCACPRVARVVVTATVVGLLTGFFGVGGGFVLVPALVLALAFPMPEAVGTSLLVIAVNSAFALSQRVQTTGIEWRVALPFLVAGLAGVGTGKRLADRLPAATLGRWFVGLLVAVAAYTALRSTLALL